ncbi:unnamed protein product [Pseudo-nitzschia multistriata]|uniref:Cytochrome P450 n=1 Tax=Pseudo-nitzschia multistriata TaxID=183589 RepID=A0A448Z5V0_9STRA|nr:unnamed protein product [Pseudo-nitzschia multistriata]
MNSPLSTVSFLADSSTLAAVVTVIGSTLALNRYFRIQRDRKRLGNFPSSTPSFLPSFDLLHAIRAGTLEKFVESRKKALGSDCFYIRLPGMARHTLCIINPEDHAEVLRKERKLKLIVDLPDTLNETHGPGSLQALSGNQHNFYRKIFASLLSPAALESFTPFLFDAFSQMWADLEEKSVEGESPVVIQDAICRTQFFLMSKVLYGMTPESTSMDMILQMRDDFEAQLEGHFAPRMSAKFKLAKEGSKRIHDVLRKKFELILEERRHLFESSNGEEKKDYDDKNIMIGNAMESVADALLKEGADRDLKVLDETIDNFDLLLEASHGTTMTMTTTAMYYLNIAENSVHLQNLREEANSFGSDHFPTFANLKSDMPYAEGVIKEALRLAPFTVGLAYAMEDNIAFTFKGQKMQGPMSFFMSFGQNFKNPSLFPEPDKFLPERWIPGSKSYVSKEAQAAFTPFGMGRHLCLGYQLAMLVMKSSLYCFAKDETRVIKFDAEKTRVKPGLFPSYSVSDGLLGRVTKN